MFTQTFLFPRTLAWSIQSIDFLRLLPLLGLGAVCYCILLVGWLLWLLTRPPRRTYASALLQGRAGDPGELPVPRAFESFTIDWEGQRLAAWSVVGDAPEGPACVLTPGWGDSRIGGLSRLPVLLPHCSRVILWDMPGHGDSSGTSTLGPAEVDALRRVIDTLDGSIVLWGWSLGAGVSIVAAASSVRVAGVISEAPSRFAGTPARAMLRVRGLPEGVWLRAALALLDLGTRWSRPRRMHTLADDLFDRSVWASRLGCPLLVVHGTRDEVCPIEDGREIASAARRGEIIEADGGHTGLWTSEASANQLTSRVGHWLANLPSQSP